MTRDEYEKKPKHILVDLDGTLAKSFGDHVPGQIGEPISRMVDRVKLWLKQGKDVRIFTARVGPSNEHKLTELVAIKAWCEEQFGKELPITCVKDLHTAELWDDRAIQILRNTGIRADGNTD